MKDQAKYVTRRNRKCKFLKYKYTALDLEDSLEKIKIVYTNRKVCYNLVAIVLGLPPKGTSKGHQKAYVDV